MGYGDTGPRMPPQTKPTLSKKYPMNLPIAPSLGPCEESEVHPETYMGTPPRPGKKSK